MSDRPMMIELNAMRLQAQRAALEAFEAPQVRAPRKEKDRLFRQVTRRGSR